jgi:thioredoxin reductase (NADPH)
MYKTAALLVHHFAIGPQDTLPGGFAAGDVRSGSVKRVASAVGEVAMAIREIHEYLTS